VLDALQQLGEANPLPGSLEERIRDTSGLATPDIGVERERTIGWEP
jgi:hypothetical protein